MLQQELEVIKQAILLEVEGYEFYRLAANQVDHPSSKEAFIELGKEELKHAEYLKGLFNKLKSSEDDAITLAFLADPPAPSIFNWEKVDGQYVSTAMAVFGVAVQLEKASIEYYEDAKAKSSFEEAKKLYDILIGWEKVHLEQFTKQYNMYKEDWFETQGFEPY